ncbi:putative disease resistance protein RGA3 [Cocos nucifera]|nr:putative disease resistance protein RGA3 [Cocos nucifera]
MYDADDILEDWRIEAEKSKAAVSSGRQPCSSCCSLWTSVCDHCRLFCFSCFDKTVFAHQIGRRIQDLNSNLEDILAEKSKFDLQIFSTGRDDHPSTSRVSRKTSPLPEKLVELLIKEDPRESILAYAIVGIGGIGKTNLAQRIFNDVKMTANFPMKLWVCVSKDFEETSLLKEIISQASEDSGGASSKAQLVPKVRKVTTNKKFLLVLDDSWESQVWNDLLRIPLQSGATTGNRLPVTTRKENVALQMKAVERHKVQLLSAEDGWAPLGKKVVSSGQEREIEDLKDIGKETVDKCDGLPLAIKTIGGVLSTKSRNKKHWEKVLQVPSNNAFPNRSNQHHT